MTMRGWERRFWRVFAVVSVILVLFMLVQTAPGPFKKCGWQPGAYGALNYECQRVWIP
jgi:hypothetical protein